MFIIVINHEAYKSAVGVTFLICMQSRAILRRTRPILHPEIFLDRRCIITTASVPLSFATNSGGPLHYGCTAKAFGRLG